MKRGRIILTFLMLLVALPAAAGINEPIKIEPGEVVNKDLSTINGRIQIGDGVSVHGEVESVNGAVRIGRDVEVDKVSAINGSVEIGEGTLVVDEVSTVNGAVFMGNGSRAREVSTVNGQLQLEGVEVETDVSTYNGDVKLSSKTSVGGDILVKDPRGNNNRYRKPLRIYIEDGSSVRGNVIVENDDLEVEIYLRGGSVKGEISGANIVEK